MSQEARNDFARIRAALEAQKEALQLIAESLHNIAHNFAVLAEKFAGEKKDETNGRPRRSGETSGQ